ncbi:MAG: L,D-transpeptidase [Clostridiales bacterium]|nr:L,D-transpeptidase [Clostridiales bacterium]
MKAIMLVLTALLLASCQTPPLPHLKKTSVKPKKYKWPKLADPQREYIECDYQNKTIEIFLKDGRGIFSACENYQVQRLGYVSAGRPSTHKTPRGNYDIQWKVKEYDSKKYPSKNGGRNMDFAMFFTSTGHAMHKGNINGLSHGCVRTQEYQAKWLYEWSTHESKIIISDMPEKLVEQL